MFKGKVGHLDFYKELGKQTKLENTYNFISFLTDPFSETENYVTYST